MCCAWVVNIYRDCFLYCLSNTLALPVACKQLECFHVLKHLFPWVAKNWLVFYMCLKKDVFAGAATPLLAVCRLLGHKRCSVCWLRNKLVSCPWCWTTKTRCVRGLHNNTHACVAYWHNACCHVLQNQPLRVVLLETMQCFVLCKNIVARVYVLKKSKCGARFSKKKTWVASCRLLKNWVCVIGCKK